MKYAKLPLVFLACVSAASAFMFGEKCTIYPQGFIPDGESRGYTVPNNCANGTIDWNYPKEYIQIHFRRSAANNYQVCLGNNLGGDMFTLYEITSTSHRQLPKDAASCLKSIHGRVDIEIHAPEFQTYMGAIDYSVQNHLSS